MIEILIALLLFGVAIGLRRHFDDIPHVNQFPQEKRKKKDEE